MQNQSGVRFALSGTAKYGATIAGYALTIENTSYTGASVSHPLLTTSGTVAYTWTVTDSRGLTATYSASLTVLPWQKPQAVAFAVERVDANGISAIDGTYVEATVKASVSSLMVSDAQKNSLKWQVGYRPIVDEGAVVPAWTYADAVTVNGTSVDAAVVLTSGGSKIGNFDDMTGYDFILTVSDIYDSSTAAAQLPTKEVYIDIDTTTGNIAIGEEDSEGKTLINNYGSRGFIDLVYDSGRVTESHPNSSETTHFSYTVPKNGMYMVLGVAQFPAGTGGTFRFGAIKYIRDGATTELVAQSCPPHNNAGPRLSMVGVLVALAGDQIIFNANQNSGASVSGAMHFQVLSVNGSDLT